MLLACQEHAFKRRWRLTKGRAHAWAGTGKSCYKSGESHEEVSDGRAERWTAAGPLPRQRGRPLRLRSPVARDRPAAGGARRARHAARAHPPRGRRGAHGRGPLQDDGPGGRRDRQPRSGLGQPARGRDHGAARGRAAGRDHVAAPAGDRVPVPAVHLPGAGPARRLPTRRQVGRADLLVGSHPRGRAARVPRDVDGPAGTGAHRAARAGPLRDGRRVERARAGARGVPRPPARGVRGPDRGGRGPARRRRATARDRRLRRRPRRGQRGAARGRRAARLPRDRVHGRSRGGAARPSQRRLWPGRRRRPRQARGRRRAGRGVAARQPRPAVRQVLGGPRDAAGGADRRRSAAHRRDAPGGSASSPT